MGPWKTADSVLQRNGDLRWPQPAMIWSLAWVPSPRLQSLQAEAADPKSVSKRPESADAKWTRNWGCESSSAAVNCQLDQPSVHVLRQTRSGQPFLVRVPGANQTLALQAGSETQRERLWGINNVALLSNVFFDYLLLEILELTRYRQIIWPKIFQRNCTHRGKAKFL